MIPKNLCNVNVKELRELAKKFDINIRNSDKKLKKKCELIVEIVKKTIEDEEEEQEEEEEEEYYFTRKPEKQKTKKSVSFGNIPENTNKKKTKSTTKRPLTAEQIKNFIPRKAKRGTRERLETKFMQAEDKY